MRVAADCVRRLAELAGVLASERRFFDWAAIEEDLGLRLPPDYKLLAESFPVGWFRRFVRVELPDRWADGQVRFPAKDSAGVLEAMREYRDTGEVEFPYPLFPEPGGLLPWGYLRDAGQAFWLTGPGDPDTWPVVVGTDECDYWDRFDGTACEFLIEVVAARYDASAHTVGAVEDEWGNVTPMHPLELSAEAVFEPETPAAQPAEPVEQPSPPEEFWLNGLLEVSWERLPVNDLDAVRELAGPPPPGVTPVGWAAVHDRLGFALPADYRAFIDAYGPGTFGDISIAAPGAPGQMELFAFLDRIHGRVRDRPRNEWDPPFCPEPGGTVSCGETASGWTIGWAPARYDPDQWTVAAIAWNPARTAIIGVKLMADISFTTTLKQHAEQKPGGEGGLLSPHDLSAGPVTFTPYN